MKIVKNLIIFSVLLAIIGIVTVSAQNYIGSEMCLVCHNGSIAVDRTGWRSSMHANGFTVPMGANSMIDLYGVVADANQNEIDDFKDGLDLSTTSAFEVYGSNAPVLGYNETEDKYTITIGDLTLPVKLTYGGSGLYKQRYIVQVPVTGGGVTEGHYVSPIQFNEKTDEYVTYHPENWYDENNLPLFSASSTAEDVASSGRSFEKKCIGCHFTYIESVSQNSDGEWVADAPDAGTMDTGNNVYDIDGDGTADLINTGCERCHGPGSTHMSTQAPEDIVNPDSLTAQQANDLCGLCHSRGHSVPNGTFSYPFIDTPGAMEDWEVGDAWGDYYSDAGGYYPDGTHEGEVKSSKKHHQQYFDFYESSKPTFMYHKVRCSECHDVHNEVKHHIREEIVEEDSLENELPIATENDNNTLCLACHATHGHFENLTKEMIADPVTYADTIAAVVSEHTHHSYDPENGPSRCSKCHNPKTIKSAVHYDIHSHTFEPISPQKTVEYVGDGGMPNACAASCHRGLENGDTPVFNTGVDVSLSDWTEATDIALADTLLHYFGPSGIWWEVDQILAVIEWVDGTIPDDFLLMQNYPNPFNPSTIIPLKLKTEGNVQVVLFNILGQQVAKLMNQYLSPGEYRIIVNAESLSSGIYFYSMTVESSQGVNIFTDQKKMIVMK